MCERGTILYKHLMHKLHAHAIQKLAIYNHRVCTITISGDIKGCGITNTNILSCPAKYFTKNVIYFLVHDLV